MNIFEWLKNPAGKYAEGVALYKQLAGNGDQFVPFFEQVNDSKPTEQHFDMLHKRLARIARIQGQNAANAKVETKEIKVKPIEIKGKKTPNTEPTKTRLKIVPEQEFDVINPKDLPKDLQVVYFGIKENFAKMKELHAHIKKQPNEVSVELQTVELTTLEDTNYKLWGKIDEWVKKGKPDGKKKEEETGRSAFSEFQENEKRIKTIKINIPRAQNELESLKKEKNKNNLSKKKVSKIDKKIKLREKNIPNWQKELEKLEKRQIELQNTK